MRACDLQKVQIEQPNKTIADNTNASVSFEFDLQKESLVLIMISGTTFGTPQCDFRPAHSLLKQGDIKSMQNIVG